MKCTIGLLSAIALFLSIVSCKKQNQEPGDPPEPPPPPEKAVQLSSYKRYVPGSTDTITNILVYDDQQRLIKIRIYKNGVDISLNDTITYAGNQIYYKNTSNISSNTGEYLDTIEVDNYKMPTKRIVSWITNRKFGNWESDLVRRSVTYYFYSQNGEFADELHYLSDSTYNITDGRIWIQKQVDTTETHLIIENNNLKTKRVSTKQGIWSWQNGTFDFQNNTHSTDYDFYYSNEYLSPPINEHNYLNFIYEFYYPYRYSSTRNNFKNIPDKIITKRPSNLNEEENFVISYSEKGYITKIEDIIGSDKMIYEYFYK